MTRDAALAQFLGWYEAVRPGFTTDPNERPEILREFDDWWKNASADSHMLSGIQYQKTWAELAPLIQERIQNRLAEGNTPGVEIIDTQLTEGARSLSNEFLDPLYASGQLALPAAYVQQQQAFNPSDAIITSSGSPVPAPELRGLVALSQGSRTVATPYSGLSSFSGFGPSGSVFTPTASGAAPSRGLSPVILIALVAGVIYFATKGN